MTYQTTWNAIVAFKAQSGLGSPASGSGASLLPLTGGAGKLSKNVVSSMQVRQDGLAVRGRHGTQKTQGQYPGELQLTNYDAIIEAVMRGSWTNNTAITQATSAMSSATMSATGSVVTFSGGNCITAGVRIGQIHRWTVGLAPADLNKPLRVVGATNTTITYAETLTTVTGPVSSYSFHGNGKILLNPPAGSLVKRYFTIEERENDIDESELFTDCMWGRIDLSMQPDGMLNITPYWTGTGAAAVENTSSSPYFTSPALGSTTAIPVAAIDATLRIGDADEVAVSGFNLSIDLGLNAPAVAASKVSPDIFDGIMKVSGSVTCFRKDLTYFGDFLGETTLSLSVLAQVPGSSPADYLNIYVPYMTLSAADKSDLKRDGGPRTQTLNFSDALVGVDQRGGAYAPTMVMFESSAT